MADSDDKTGAGGKKTLTLKGGPAMGARPGMSRGGRSTVVVEKRTRVVPRSNAAPPATQHPTAPVPPAAAPRPAPLRDRARPPLRGPAPAPARPVGLSTAEAEARQRALREAGGRTADDNRRLAEAEARRTEDDARRREIREAANRDDAARAARATQTETAPAEAGGVALQEPADRGARPPIAPRRPLDARPAARRPGGPAPIPNMPPPAPPSEADGRRTRSVPPAGGRPALVGDAEARRGPGGTRATPERPVRRAGDENAFARARLTVSTATTESDRDRGPSLAAMRRRRDKKMGRNQQAAPKLMREVIIPDAITVQELANRMSERSVTVIKMLMAMERMATINDILDADTAELLATELGHTVKRVSEADVESGLYDVPSDDKAEDLTHRAPVVTIMGHVDHGKTSLLDAIRETNVVSGEAGGITQHIGAYQVEIKGQKITFLDTPGHEAFTAMRARGAQATDIAVLVVAADDGVMPQTIESIRHAKAAGVPIIVAINKMDKHDANPLRVRTELLQHDVQVESMGGETLDVEVSAIKKTGLDKLLETILLQAEVLELQVPRDGRAEGLVIEAKLDRGRGAVATVLVQRGTLKVSDIVVAGIEFARVRALIDDKGAQVKEGGPSAPVEVLGFTGVPSAGDRFSVVESEARAREVTSYRQRQIREKTEGGGATSLEQMMNQLKVAGISKFPLIIKGDVQGSVEAINTSLNKLSTEEVSA
ncbi:MAG: translation initiation factor IF-2, partial [Devosia sp.]